MRQEIFPFALPPPVLTGSGSLSIISVPSPRDTPLRKYRDKVIKLFLILSNFLPGNTTSKSFVEDLTPVLVITC